MHREEHTGWVGRGFFARFICLYPFFIIYFYAFLYMLVYLSYCRWLYFSINLFLEKKIKKEKVGVAEQETELSFMKKKWDAEWQDELLRLEEQIAKARTSLKIYENENHDQEMALKMEEHKQGKNIY